MQSVSACPVCRHSGPFDSEVCPKCQAPLSQGSALNLGVRSSFDHRDSRNVNPLIPETEELVPRRAAQGRQIFSSATRTLVREHYDQGLKTFPQVHLSFESFHERVCEVLGKNLPLSPEEGAYSSWGERANQLLTGLKWEDLFLATACAEGDEAAWVSFQSRYQSVIRKAARYCTDNASQGKEISESLMTDLFLPSPSGLGKSASKIAQYDGMGSLEGWIRVVVSRMAIDQIRRHQKQVSLEDLDTEPVAAGPVSMNPSSERKLDMQKATAMLQPSLDYALDQLTSQEKLVLKLYYLQDANLKEIGLLLNVHESTASRMVARIKKHMRKSVERHLQDFFHVRRREIRHLIATAQSQVQLDLDRVFNE